MKVNRRRALFYQRRTSNLYRLFALALFIIAGVWIVIRLKTGEIRNPFDPTPTSTRTINSWVLEGEASFNAGDLPAAITAYQEATRVDPNNAEALAELARIQAYSSRLLSNDTDRLTRLTEAQQSADQAKALAPDDSNVLAIRAFVLDWNADPNLDALRTGGKMAAKLIIEADQEALRAISLNSQNPLALAFYAEILIDEQKWTQAEQYIQSALQLGPQVMDVHRVYGYYLESIKYYRQAIEEYQQALTINPNLTFLYISIGHNYRTLANNSPKGSQQTELYNQALESYAKAVRLNEQKNILDPSPYLAIAKTYVQQGEFFAAARNAQKAVALDPTNADLYGQLGGIYKSGRNFETAIFALQCAVDGCTPEGSCLARNGCPAGDEGVTVIPLHLSPRSAIYYLDYGSVLAAFSPQKPSYCDAAVRVLTLLIQTYSTDQIILGNAADGLSICANVLAAQTQTPTPVTTPASTIITTPMPGYTPRP
ncbi:MAG: tetratricopeptide repeat protein [Chloroflexi bacterium]|nr:MAG: tetratricopeptide repeat protein [Chloroflexota bacterium]